MLVVVTVLCVLLAWKARQVERQKEAVVWVEETSCTQFVAASKQAGETEVQRILRSAFEAARAIRERPTQQRLLEEIGSDLACAGDLVGARRVVDAIENAKGADSVTSTRGDERGDPLHITR